MDNAALGGIDSAAELKPRVTEVLVNTIGPTSERGSERAAGLKLSVAYISRPEPIDFREIAKYARVIKPAIIRLE